MRAAALPLFLLSLAAAPAEQAALVLDLESGRVLHARNAELLHPPASLAKLMTAYLVFEALRAGTLDPAEPVTLSERAAAQPAMELGLAPGSVVPAETLLRAMLLRSSNDAAVALAERLAGSEAAFARRMTKKARALGMGRTAFENASGLPNPAQQSTALELATLSAALWRDFPERRALFRERSVVVDGERLGALNGFLDRIPGARGLKTGFTCQAGYGLVVIARRGERRLLGVVLGAPTPEQRDERMDVLLARAEGQNPEERPTLASLVGRTDQGAARTPARRVIARVCLEARPDRAPAGWAVDLGAADSAEAAARSARAHLRTHRNLLRGGEAYTVPRLLDTLVHRVWITGLDEAQASAACAELRAADAFCLTLSPTMVRRAVERSRQLETPSAP